MQEAPRHRPARRARPLCVVNPFKTAVVCAVYRVMSSTERANERPLSKEGDGAYRRHIGTCSAAGFVNGEDIVQADNFINVPGAVPQKNRPGAQALLLPVSRKLLLCPTCWASSLLSEKYLVRTQPVAAHIKIRDGDGQTQERGSQCQTSYEAGKEDTREA